MSAILRLTACCLVLAALSASAQNPEIYAGGTGACDAASADIYGTVAYPQINNLAGATGITDSVAWLNGTLTCTSDSPTTVYLYWGATDGTNDSDAWDHATNFGVRVAWEALSTNVDVAANTEYYYRFYATNEQGETWSWPSAGFKAYGPPTVEHRAVYYISPSSVTFQGALDNGAFAHTRLYFGQSTNMWTTNDFGWITEQTVWTNIPDLSAGTAYVFQYCATNDYGESRTPVLDLTTGTDIVFESGDGDGYDRYWGFVNASTTGAGTLFFFE